MYTQIFYCVGYLFVSDSLRFKDYFFGLFEYSKENITYKYYIIYYVIIT